ncbi:MAG: hypothetical protein K6C30_02670 [Bacteroidaceae bacterium]|nr:hypothetical protein [Bacteroidaceae bacterium]
MLALLYAPIVSAIGNVMDFMVGTSELDFILRFLAMAELKRASFCSFGLAKTFVGIALGFAASLVEEPAQGACQGKLGDLREHPTNHLCSSTRGTMAVQNYSKRGKHAIGKE